MRLDSESILTTGISLISIDTSTLVESRCVSCKVQAFWAPSGTNHKAELAISVSGWLGRYTNVSPQRNGKTSFHGICHFSTRVVLYKRAVFTKCIPEETRTITVPILSGYNTTLPLNVKGNYRYVLFVGKILLNLY